MTSSRSLRSRRCRMRKGGPVLLASVPRCGSEVWSWPLLWSPRDFPESLRNFSRNLRLFRTLRWPVWALEIAISDSPAPSLSRLRSPSAIAKLPCGTGAFSETVFAGQRGSQ